MKTTSQKIKFSIKDSFSKCDQIRKKLDLVNLLKKSLMENFIFCAVCLEAFFVLFFKVFMSS